MESWLVCCAAAEACPGYKCSMIRWTASGAVSSPRTLQIRVQRRYPSRVQAGAPHPSRSLTAAELRANIRHFTEGMRTPRTAPCTSLVLSGAGVAQRPDLIASIQLARQCGVQWITLHVDAADLSMLPLPLLSAVDVLVIPLAAETLGAAADAIEACRLAGTRSVANVTLTEPGLHGLPQTLDCLVRAAAPRVVLTYPFPTGRAPHAAPSPSAAAAAIDDALRVLDQGGVSVSVKGLPACYLGSNGHRLARTTNRWYVDAEHQRADALLFFPGVTAFYKAETCRFCAADHHCDGFFKEYLAQDGARPLSPVHDEWDLSEG